MKRQFLLLFIVFFAIIFLSSCCHNDYDEKQIEMTLFLNEGKLRYVVINSSSYQIFPRNRFVLERQMGRRWVELPLRDGIAHSDVQTIIRPHSSFVVENLDLYFFQTMFGYIENGTYRITQTFEIEKELGTSIIDEINKVVFFQVSDGVFSLVD